MTAKLKMIANIIEQLAPLTLKDEWDNVGLLIGDYNADIKKVMTALEITDEVIAEAIEKNVNMIVTHHPLIFKPLKSLTENNAKASKIRRLIKADINYYAAHTNFDYAFGGMGDLVAEKIGLKNSEPYLLEERAGHRAALARVGELEIALSPEEFAKNLATIYERDINYYNNQQSIKRVAVIGGAGMEFVRGIAKSGVDAFVTGDIKYHEVMENTYLDMSIYDVGHFDSEIIFAEKMAEYLREQVEKQDLEVEIIVSAVEKSPFSQARY